MALDGLQNVSELLKTALEAEGAVQRNLASLADLRAMLESPRVRKATGPLEVRDYVERVRSRKISLPSGMSLSGALAVMHRAGPSGLAGDARFPETEALRNRAEGIF